jgi:excisionase family DNA binding protein
MALVTLSEAARLAGVSRQTIYRKAASGELSTVRQEDGSKGVDTSELARVFGNLRTPETVSETVTSDTVRQAVTGPDSAVLQAQLDAAHQVIAAQEARITDLQADKAKLWEQVEGQRLLLEHKPQEQQGSRFIEYIVAAAIVLVALTGIVVLLR